MQRLSVSFFFVSLLTGLLATAGCSLVRSPILPEGDAGMDAPLDAPDRDVPGLDARDTGQADVPMDGFVPLDAPSDGGVDAPTDSGVDAPRDSGVDAPIDPCSLCTATQMCCGGVCLDTESDPLHCGSCDACAAAPRSSPTCNAGTCELACDPDYADCNGTYADGCEADLGALSTCNSCGNACTDYPNTTEACVAAGCSYTCGTAFQNCGGPSPDCETDTNTSVMHCGACGRACGPSQTCDEGTCRGWRPVTGTGAPRARTDHVAHWTGTEMIIWGGQTGAEELGDGALYNPATNTWRAMSNTGAPSRRRAALSVWTGSRMIVWSGYDRDMGWLGDGAIYDPATNTWAALPITGAPEGRSRSVAVWTGTEMIFWSGWIGTGTGRSGTGAAFNPATGVWDALPGPGLASRRFHGAVWTGSQFVFWGGDGTTSNKLNSGSRYDRAMDSWSGTTGTGAPSARTEHAVLYVPSAARMVVFGGLVDGGFGDAGTASGARYDPAANTWAAMSASPLMGRLDMAAVSTDSEMLVWGGRSNDDGGPMIFGDGARYAPATDTWNALQSAGAPSPRYFATAVWTGTEMIVFGGLDGAGNVVGVGAALGL